jgi:hypothetical protein
VIKFAAVKSNLALCDRAVELKQSLEGEFLELAKLLKEIKSKKAWEGRWENYEHFCEGELKLSKGTVSKLVSVYEIFIETHKVSAQKLKAIGWTAAYTLLPVVNTKTEAEQWLATAQEMQSGRDLAALVREKRTGIVEEDCEHTWIRFELCTRCNQRRRLYPQEKAVTPLKSEF